MTQTAKIDIHALAHLTLGRGSGGSDVCMMESIAMLTGEQRTDHPACVAPSLIVMGIRLNDWATDAQRQTLKAFVPRVIGTAGDAAAEERRTYLCIDAAVREFAPLWLDRAGLTEWADRLRALPEIVDAGGANDAERLTFEARNAASSIAVYGAAAISTTAANAAAANAISAHAAAYATAANAAAYATAANAATAASGAAAPPSAADMGMWGRLSALYGRLIRVGETPLGLDAEPVACRVPERVTA